MELNSGGSNREINVLITIHLIHALGKLLKEIDGVIWGRALGGGGIWAESRRMMRVSRICKEHSRQRANQVQRKRLWHIKGTEWRSIS